jgi:SH3 domain-containing YSC84-like protein 1
MDREPLLLLCAPLLLTASALAVGAANADDQNADDQNAHEQRAAQNAADSQSGDAGDEMRDAKAQVSEATKVVQQMKRDPKLTALLQRANGVFVAPDYGKGAAVVGARGGEGVVLLRNGDDWSNPAFYNFGGLSIGAQVGGAGGSFAMLLMNDRAVDAFRTKNSFSLDASAGLTIVDYSAGSQAATGKGDVIVWSDTEGLFAGASLGISGIVRDEAENRAYYDAYYGQKVSVEQVLSGALENPDAQKLRDALPDRVASSR